MIKRLLLTLVVAAITISAMYGQLATGTWRHYPVYGNAVTRIVDTPEKVYYVNSNFLYGYDKKNDETITYDRSNILSDVAVKNIYYNKEGKYLAVAFENGNIDLIYDDGNIVNLPEVMDASLLTTPSINNIAFEGSNIYVATNFGLVIYDESHHEVRQSGIYNKNVSHVIPMRDYIVIVIDNIHYIIPKDLKINKFENFKRNNLEYSDCNAYVVMNSQAGIYAGNRYSTVRKFAVNPSTGLIEASNYAGFGSNITNSNLIPTDDAIFFILNDGKIYSIDKAEGKWKLHGTAPSGLLGSDLISFYKDLKNVWAAGETGLSQYDFSKLADGGNVTVLTDNITIKDATTVSKPAYMIPGVVPGEYFVTNLGRSGSRPSGNGEGTNLRQQLDLYSDGRFESVAPQEVSAKMQYVINAQNALKGKYLINPTRVVQDPDDPSIIYMGSGSEGIYVIKDGEEIGKFDDENSPFDNLAGGGWRCIDVRIDKAGNLWAGFHSATHYVIVLPAEKRRKSPSQIVESDWINMTKYQMASYKDLSILPCEMSNIVLVNLGEHYVVAIDTRGTYDNFNDDLSKMYESYIDQDGKEIKISHIYAMAEDKDGKVWLGTREGVYEITRPAQMMNADFRINHIKVPRNDGTNLADYLLSSEIINDITVDNSNRKWIATQASGVYLVSPNGDEILNHFTAENSFLASNSVYCIYADPTSNSVFMGTSYGINEYSSDSSPSREDYSEVYAYPNPVTPEYTGWITITGLMSDSRIKICDSAMQVVYETRSEGGMATWDACNFSGARVKSGVYYVLASTGSENQSAAGDVVAKILIVN